MMHSNLWEELKNEAASIFGHGILKRMIGANRTFPMFLGIQQPGMKRAFIIQVPKDSAPLPEMIQSSKGFHFNILFAGDETNPEHISLILSASNEAYNDIFVSIVDDLQPKLERLENRKELISTFLNRVRLWQIFFEKQRLEGMSEESQKGLYGELYFLERYILRELKDTEVIRYWLGTQNRQHDFQFGNISVEVKTTSAKQHQKLYIASEQQLDETLVEKLYLFYLSVSLIQNSNNTLPALIQNIRKYLQEDTLALEAFNSLLIERGYLDIHSNLYEHLGYSIRNSGFFIVQQDFPRIKENELRKGVGDVKYSIAIDACTANSVPDEEFLKNLKELFNE